MTEPSVTAHPSAPGPTRAAPSVHVVIVTYGDRAEHVEQVLRALDHLEGGDQVGTITVVDNAAAPPTRDLLERAQRDDARLEVLPMPSNTGSAGGFAAGIEHAIASGADLIWLLDDDNAPEPEALAALLGARANSEDPESTALCSLRTARPGHRRLARGLTVAEVYPRSSNFMGFHVADIGRKLAGRLGTDRVPPDGPLAVPFAPYGGLLLPRSLGMRIGLPDRRFFTYADDTDYTLRIVRDGGRLFAVPTSRIDDVDASWDATEGASILQQRLLRGNHAERAYLTTRNHAFVSRHRTRTSPLEYALNRLVFLFVLVVIGATTGRRARLRLLLEAVRSGERGEFDSLAGAEARP